MRISRPSWFGFLITVKEGIDRKAVVEYVESHGVQTRNLFAGNLIKHPCFDEMRATGEGYRVVGGLDTYRQNYEGHILDRGISWNVRRND